MAWTEITRLQYDRRAYRYASDCSDEAGESHLRFDIWVELDS